MSAEQTIRMLCSEYGLAESAVPLLLVDIARAVDKGEYLPVEAMLEDKTILETARLLKQMKRSIRIDGKFSVVEAQKIDYTDIAPELEDHLEGRLSQYVEKHKSIKKNGVECGSGMILKKGWGSSGYTARGVLVMYPESVGYCSEGWSEAELGLIIAREEELAERLKSMKGRIRKGKEGLYSWSALLGKWADWILAELDKVPLEKSESQKLCLAGDCLECLGLIELKGSEYVEDWGYKSSGEKQRAVRDWILAYKEVIE